jgi:hypothetical protein
VFDPILGRKSMSLARSISTTRTTLRSDFPVLRSFRSTSRSSAAIAAANGFEVALFACFGVSIDIFPGFSYSYSASAVLVLMLVLEDTPSSTIKVKSAQLQKPSARKSLLCTEHEHGEIRCKARNPFTLNESSLTKTPRGPVFESHGNAKLNSSNPSCLNHNPLPHVDPSSHRSIA